MDEIRIIKNLAVYTTDFIPPQDQLTQTASPLLPLSAGTFLFSQCVSGNLVGTYSDGFGGRYTQTISEGSC